MNSKACRQLKTELLPQCVELSMAAKKLCFAALSLAVFRLAVQPGAFGGIQWKRPAKYAEECLVKENRHQEKHSLERGLYSESR